jgi:cell division transport system permease protein
MSAAVQEAIRTARRSPLLSVLSVLTVAFSLFAFGLFGLVAVNIHDALQRIEDRIEIRAFVVDGTSPSSISAVQEDIAAFPEVEAIGYVTPDSALARARTQLAEFRDLFDASMLPASFEIRVRESARSPETVNAIAERIASYAIIDDVRYGAEWVTKLYQLRTVAALAGGALAAAFALVAVLIIGATVRMAVSARADEIEIMRVIGASKAFVRRPYLYDGAAAGLLGALLAAVMCFAVQQGISRTLFTTVFFTPVQLAAGIVAGVLLGTLASQSAVNRLLRD